MPNALLSHLQAALEGALDAGRAPGPHGRWVLAFSGGPDSTALALALAELAPRHRLEIHAFHVDHALDEDSPARARAAAELAAQIGLPFRCERHPVAPELVRREGKEASARMVRYAALEDFRERIGADRILTAHHRDDQIETVLLRIRAGSGISGLGGIASSRGRLFRPLLDLPRAGLLAFVTGCGITPITDPTNRHLAFDRNRIRHRILPHLRNQQPALEAALASVAAAAVRARDVLDRRLEKLLVKGDPEAVRAAPMLDAGALLALPGPVGLQALGLLERLVGRERPGSMRSKLELLRQLRLSGRVRLAAGAGLEWRASEGWLTLAPPVPATPPFSYILEAPGEVEIPELRGRLRLSRQPLATWMRVGSARRAALAIPGAGPTRVEVRNRRPGDAIRPLGGPGIRRLKELLIDQKVPRAERDSLPLLLIDGSLAWVPGMTIDHRFRLLDDSSPWVAEWIDNPIGEFRRITSEDVPVNYREESEI
jgi:tRNA(Ile)-lysidine synthase